MRILVAPDKFKSCLGAADVAKAIAAGVMSAGADAECIPLADGGEGTAEILAAAAGGEMVECATVDPLGRHIIGKYYVKGPTAYMDVAAASGMWLLADGERQPLNADTRGTGLMMADALRRGCRNFIIGLGGSATVDGGVGMMEALTEDGRPAEGLADSVFTLVTDVDAPLCGPQGAARVFGPQKGATPEETEILDDRLKILAARLGVDPAIPGMGAAGGFALMLTALYGRSTRIVRGADYVLSHAGFDVAARNCDVVITAEGHIDRQTLMGKLPMEVMRSARRAGVGAIAAFAGKVDDREDLLSAGFTEVAGIHRPGISREEAMHADVTRKDLSATAERWVRSLISSANH